MMPHAGQPVVHAGLPLHEATAAMILVHGRGAAPANILELAEQLDHPAFAYLAPAAAGNTWYPQSFMAPFEANEPGLSSGLSVLSALVDRVASSGITHDRIVLAGFSQGACLASEFAARHARRYGALLAFSGGLIGPPGTSWPYDGDFDGMPVFLGCSDLDHHVPRGRVEETAIVLESMGAQVEMRLYPGMGHLIIEDELAYARTLVAAVGAAAAD
jgi:predicted esterase